VDVRSGFTTPNLLEADANRAFVNATRQLAVTDAGMPEDVVRLLADRVSDLVIVSVNESRS
jgi:hypothetical protein